MSTGTLLDTNPEPGSTEWFKYMTASKISAVMHHSTYDSYLSTWLKMAGKIQPEPDDDIKRRGHYLEPAIRAWFQDQHPDWYVQTTGMWVHHQIPWAAATPDGIITTPDAECGFEAKSSNLDYEWGDPGTNQIPAGYFDQVQWQMFVTGFRKVHVAVLMNNLVFAEYVVEYDAAYVANMVATAETFMDTLERGERPSLDPLDGHAATYKAIRELAPGIEARDVDLPTGAVAAYINANQAKRVAENMETAAKTIIADHMGEAKTGSWNGQHIFNRQSKNGGTPYLVAARSLPTLQDMEHTS